MILASFVIVALSYLLGSIPTGYLLVKLFRHEDIRSVGSGNIGATNVLRSGGKGLGAATFLLDVLKGAAAVWLGSLLASFLLPSMPFRDAQALAAVSAVLGHMFPVWLGFRGAKESPPDLASSWSPRPWRLFPRSLCSQLSCWSRATFRSPRSLVLPAFLCLHGFSCTAINPYPTSPHKSSSRF